MARQEDEAVRARLMALREELRIRAQEKLREAKSLADTGVADPGDQGLNDDMSDLMHLLSDRDRDQLLAVDEALDRLEAGTYGVCERCGGEIEEARLAALPFALHCVECQEDIEREETPPGAGRRGKI